MIMFKREKQFGTEPLELPFTTSPEQAQRIAAAHLNRQFLTVTCPGHSLKVGDFVSIPYTRRRTFWEWLTRFQPIETHRVYKITASTFDLKRESQS